MKQILLFVMVFASVSLCAINQSAFLFLSFEPSGINRAMGGGVTGVVNIWHNNPLTVYTNPAVSAFHEGFAYGYSKEDSGHTIGIRDIFYNSSMLTYGYEGMAIMLPGYNASERFGITLDSGMLQIVDSSGQTVGEFHDYDHATTFGIALNAFETYRKIAMSDHTWLKYVDLAIGANYIDVHSQLATAIGFTDTGNNTNERSLNIGGISRLNYCYDRTLAFEAVYGLSHFNVEANEAQFVDQEEADPIWSHRNQGYALGVSLKGEKLAAAFIPEQFRFFDNFLTFRYLNATLDPLYDTNERITGSGIEFGFLDTFFIRNGQYDDDAGHINGKTSGYGINLHYRNLLGFSYNYAEVPGGEIFQTRKTKDYSVNIDFINLFQVLRN